MIDYFLIGQITSAYGKSGFVKISSHSDFPERFFDLQKIFIDFFGDKKVFIVKEVKQVKNFFILKFENFNTDKDVVPLLGKQLFVDNESLFKLPTDHYYIHDLIGCSVFQESEKLGIIKEVLQLPANDVYVVENQEGAEVLIPAVKKFIDKFDVKKKIVFLTADFEVSEDNED